MVTKFLKRILDRSGSVAPIVALTALPLMLSVGSAIDFGRYISRETEVQNALDSAVIAAAVKKDVTVAEAGDIIHKMLEVNLMGAPDWEVASVVVTDEFVEATFREPLPTTFMQLAGVEKMNIEVSAGARRPEGLVEVALVLDNTGSMAGTRISSLRDAATELVNILEERAIKAENLKIALVPFVTSVNIKTPGVFKESWIDKTGASPYNGHNMSGTDLSTKNHWAVFQKLAEFEPTWAWKGCVEARPQPYAFNDEPPNLGSPSTLFVPYLWPDEPDTPTTTDKTVTVSRYDNSYLADQNTGTVEQRQAYLTKYRSSQVKIPQKPTPALKPFNTHGPNKSCGQPIQQLTTNMDVVRSAISIMRPWDDSGTNVAEGLAWGWRVLSPGEPYTEGAPFGTTSTRKYIILLTDGENVVYQGDTNYAPTSHNKSQYTSWGY
ncbi:MAG TPA: TadE/TadG family type IV pilus assembly protein, partial [Methylomirabilota bacterium]|nr:TadE/TadG family type IV pilus assembly protein [Methylomirabilota bacterium]